MAVVGTGNIARVHAKAIATLPAATIVAATDTEESQLGPFCAEFGIPGGYRNLDDRLGRLTTYPASRAVRAG